MIYFVEGIPGGGKSTFSRQLFVQLDNSMYYKEEYNNPIDLLRQAVLAENEYNALLRHLESICAKDEYACISQYADSSVTRLNGMAFFPFVHAPTQSKAARQVLDALFYKEVDDGMASQAVYRDILKSRIKKFVLTQNRNTDYIFEGALFHNPLYTLLGFYSNTRGDIIDFYREIHDILRDTDYTVLLLSPKDIPGVVQKTVAARRKCTDFNWLDGFNRWFSLSKNYRSYSGISGLVRFSEEMADIQDAIVKSVPFHYQLIQREE